MLSLKKLEIYLSSKGLIIKRCLCLKDDNSICYIELYIPDTAEILFLYIPSKYNIEYEGNYDKREITPLDVEKLLSISEEYGKELDDYELEKNYGDSIELENTNVEGMKDSYKKSLLIRDKNKNVLSKLRGILRQLERFKFSVENLKYKIAILSENYLCCIRRDNSIQAFELMTETKYKKRMILVTDLESLYSSKHTVHKDMKLIKQGVHSLLDKNRNVAISCLEHIMDNLDESVEKRHLLDIKRDKMSKTISECESMLSALKSKELEIYKKLDNESSQKSNGITSDMNKSRSVSILEEEVKKITDLKNRVVKELMKTRENLEELYMDSDIIWFDTTIMTDAIRKNLKRLNRISHE